MTKVKKKSKPKKVSFKKYYLHYLYCLAIIIFLSLAGFNLNNYFLSQKVLGTSTDVSPLENEKEYWQVLVENNPTYIDGYIQLARVDAEMGNKVEAQNLLQKALTIDPNNSKIISVREVLGL